MISSLRDCEVSTSPINEIHNFIRELHYNPTEFLFDEYSSIEGVFIPYHVNEYWQGEFYVIRDSLCLGSDAPPWIYVTEKGLDRVQGFGPLRYSRSRYIEFGVSSFRKFETFKLYYSKLRDPQKYKKILLLRCPSCGQTSFTLSGRCTLQCGG